MYVDNSCAQFTVHLFMMFAFGHLTHSEESVPVCYLFSWFNLKQFCLLTWRPGTVPQTWNQTYWPHVSNCAASFSCMYAVCKSNLSQLQIFVVDLVMYIASRDHSLVLSDTMILVSIKRSVWDINVTLVHPLVHILGLPRRDRDFFTGRLHSLALPGPHSYDKIG